MKTTPIAMSVHPDDQSPIYGEGATHILIEDESGGPFLILRQQHDQIKPGEVRFDWDEFEQVVLAARALMKAQPKE